MRIDFVHDLNINESFSLQYNTHYYTYNFCTLLSYFRIHLLEEHLVLLGIDKKILKTQQENFV